MCVNVDIKSIMKERGVCRWQVADFLGVSESTITRYLRHELKPELKEKILHAIEKISQEKGAAKIQSAGSPFVVEKGGTIGECTM